MANISVSYDPDNIDLESGSGLCVYCDNAVEEHDVAIVIEQRHAYLAHRSCAFTEDEDG